MSDDLRSCIHCGLCLNDCPTYKLTGNEANSPRGRLLQWKAEKDGTVRLNKSIDYYTDECVGCLACESACPSKVPYGSYLAERRRKQVLERRSSINWKIQVAGMLIKFPRLFHLLLTPGRIIRKMDISIGYIFPGKTSAFQSSKSYADNLRKKIRPTGPTLALHIGCLMEGLFREINFSTINVLMRHNFNVVVPPKQVCCGAIYEHTGMKDPELFQEKNNEAFIHSKAEIVLSNSAGCGLSLSKGLNGSGMKFQDVISFLGESDLQNKSHFHPGVKLYVDLPCHLVHGQKVEGIPVSIMEAIGYQWEYVPDANDCCGAGGTYQIQKPGNAKSIIKDKSSFLNSIPSDIYPVIVTSNHVCMMQWNSAKKIINRPFSVYHPIQLLDGILN